MKYLFFALLLNTSTAFCANLLVNSDFEVRPLPESSSAGFIPDWGKTPVSPGQLAAGIIRRSDDPLFALPLQGNIGILPLGSGIVQTLPVNLLPETTYRLSLDYRVPTYNPAVAEMQAFSFGVGLGTGLSNTSALTSDLLPTAVFESGGVGNGQLFVKAEVGGRSIHFEFTTGEYADWAWSSPAFYVRADDNNTREVLIDNLSLSAVPEPSIWSLLAVALVGSWALNYRIRRHKN